MKVELCPSQKLHVLIKPIHEIWNKEKFEPDLDVKVITGAYQISYAFGGHWLWKEKDVYHIGYQLEPCYWNRDYEHILVREVEDVKNELKMLSESD